MTQREQDLQSLEAQMHRAIRTDHRELVRRLARLIEANSGESQPTTIYHIYRTEPDGRRVVVTGGRYTRELAEQDLAVLTATYPTASYGIGEQPLPR